MHAIEHEVFNHTLQTTNIWLKELMAELRWKDRHKAYMALKVSLHALRDRLTVAEAAHLGAQLPMLVRGFYYESWSPAKPIKDRHKGEFAAHVKEHFKNDPDVDPEKVLCAVFRVLSRHVTEGEIEQVRHMLPPELRELWPVLPAGRGIRSIHPDPFE